MVPSFLRELGFPAGDHDTLRFAHVEGLGSRYPADTLFQEGNARIARCVPVGVSAPRARRGGGGNDRVTLFWDPGFPDPGWLALGDGFPPALWAPERIPDDATGSGEWDAGAGGGIAGRRVGRNWRDGTAASLDASLDQLQGIAVARRKER